MKRSTWIRVATEGSVAGAAVTWRYRGSARVTVVLKASFALVHGGSSTLRGAAEIIDEDRPYNGNPVRSIQLASDLVPYRARCDVTLRGRAHPPVTFPASPHSIRLGVGRGPRAVLDRLVTFVGAPEGAGAMSPRDLVYENALATEANPVGSRAPSLVDAHDPRRAASFGAVSPFWPTRKRLLEGVDRRALDAPVGVIPDAMSADFFQSAARENQIEPLLGDERVVLDGVHPTLPRIDTRLPRERASARLVFADRPDVFTPFELVCDTLSIDAERSSFDLAWRGQLPVSEEALATPGALVVLGALAPPEATIDWSAILKRAREIAPAARVERGPSLGAGVPGEATVPDVSATPARPALPFRSGEIPVANGASPPPARASTEATPWSTAPLPGAPPTAPGEGTIDLRTHEPGEATAVLTSRDEAAVRARPVAPFAVAEPKADAPSRPAPWLASEPWAASPSLFRDEGTASLEAPTALPEPPRAEPVRTKEEMELAKQLRGAGASQDEVAAMLAAIAPPKRGA
ncbi:MAG: DUF2169 domain-containing protein [Polyangiaceae bacterium]